MVCLASYVLADGIAIIYFILFYFILFVQLYQDVMDNYGFRLCSVFNLLCCGRWNSHFIYLMKASIKQNKKTNTNQGTDKNTAKTGSNNKPYILVPYVQGMSESCKNICRKHGLKCISKRPYQQGLPNAPQGQR